MKKRWYAGLGALALVATIPFASNTPVLANLEQAREAIVQALKRPDVRLELSAAKQVTIKGQDGKDETIWQNLGDKAVVQPGDLLLYTIQGENKGRKAAKNLVVSQPIPQGMVYELNSAQSYNGAEITFSIDNGKTFVAKPTIEEILPNGEIKYKEAPADAYTNIRWKFNGSINPEGKTTATYQLKVR